MVRENRGVFMNNRKNIPILLYRKTSCLLLCLLLCTAFVSAQTVNYGSFNIRYADGDRGTRYDWQNRRDTMARFVREAELSICGMQEVLHEQLLDLVRLLPEYDYVGVGRDDGKTRGEYSPIFFRRAEWEALQSGTFWLSETPDSIGSKGWDAALPRIATWAMLKSRKTKRCIICVNTHFDHVGEQARVESGRLILRMVRKIAGKLPMVLTGDFNVGMQSSVYQSIMHDPNYPLLDSFLMGAQHEGVFYSWHAFTNIKPEKCQKIDFIFVSPNVQVTRTCIPQEDRSLEPTLMSDHNPVIATLKFK